MKKKRAFSRYPSRRERALCSSGGAKILSRCRKFRPSAFRVHVTRKNPKPFFSHKRRGPRPPENTSRSATRRRLGASGRRCCASATARWCAVPASSLMRRTCCGKQQRRATPISEDTNPEDMYTNGGDVVQKKRPSSTVVCFHNILHVSML